MTTPPTPTRRFAGRTAIVTLADHDLGLSIAKRLIAEGAGVCLSGRDQDLLDKAVADLGGVDNAVAVAGENEDVWHQMRTTRLALESFGSIDVLVHTAETATPAGPVLHRDPAAVGQAINENYGAAISWVQQVYDAWMGSRGGVIINIVSMGALEPVPGIDATTSALLIHLTRELAVELGPDIRVSIVASSLAPAFDAAVPVRNAFPPRLDDYDKVAAAVAFLASEEAAGLNGQTIAIHAGAQ
ncbi:SDR family oxidoreductase [Nocardia heshunensis]